jgi:hypothetical protein
MKTLPPLSLRALAIVAVVAGCFTTDSIIPTASANGYGNCGCNQYGPHRSGYRYGRTNYGYGARNLYGGSRVSTFRSFQSFGSAHPRSLIGRYGYGSNYGYPYTSSVVSYSRFGGYFPYRTSASTVRYGRTFGYSTGSMFPRYRLQFGQTITPSLPGSMFGGTRFISTDGDAVSIPADEGWILLSEGSAANAVAAFDNRITDNPGNMMAKVGLSLSFASAGDLTVGAWHMRQACSSDVDVLKLVLLNDELTHQVEHLIRSYSGALSRNNANRQKLFMLASLNYLAGNKRAAETAITSAIRNGDRTPAARHLQKLIEDFDIDQQPALVQN